MYWGYGSGVIATKVPGWGEFVLAEHTQTFNRSDISYFFPLMDQVYERLSFRPLFGAFDPAFDAHVILNTSMMLVALQPFHLLRKVDIPASLMRAGYLYVKLI